MSDIWRPKVGDMVRLKPLVDEDVVAEHGHYRCIHGERGRVVQIDDYVPDRYSIFGKDWSAPLWLSEIEPVP